MQKEGKTLEKEIQRIVPKFLEETENKEVLIISHHDTDGITSATIMIKTLKALDKKFSVQIVKNLEKSLIEKLPDDKVLLFLDLASGNLADLEKLNRKDIFVIDHHEIPNKVPPGINLLNPELLEKQKISASGLTYLFCKAIDPKNKALAKLAILGMIGDRLDAEISKLNNGILEDGEIQIKKGLLIYPSTRPLNRTLEYSSNPYIPEVTGNVKGVLELLRETGLNPVNGKYPSIINLNKEEMEKLVTAILLRKPKASHEEILGNIYLLKFFNKLEDARELSAMINACSRLGESPTAIQFCMELPSARKRAESIHVKYKQHLISGLRFAEETEKIQGAGFVIINAKDQIKDTIVGTIASIISSSSIYEKGTVIVTMAHSDDKIKISARNAGRSGRNLRETLGRIMQTLEGEVGGHELAAGCLILKENEKQFIELLKKHLEVEEVKI